MTREAAARFSFLLSTPAIAAAALKDFQELRHAGGVPPEMRLPYVVGIVVSAVTGMLVIGFFLKYLRQHTFRRIRVVPDRVWHNTNCSSIFPLWRMTFLSPARHSRLNEVVGFLLFLLGLGIALSLASFSPSDPSWDTANQVVRTQNLLGRLGAFTADLLLQVLWTRRIPAAAFALASGLEVGSLFAGATTRAFASWVRWRCGSPYRARSAWFLTGARFLAESPQAVSPAGWWRISWFRS